MLGREHWGCPGGTGMGHGNRAWERGMGMGALPEHLPPKVTPSRAGGVPSCPRSPWLTRRAPVDGSNVFVVSSNDKIRRCIM